MELLVWKTDKPMNDPKDIGTALHKSSYKAGDVIIAKPDGWGWTKDELNHPNWVVIKCPLLDVEAQALVQLTQNASLAQVASGVPQRAKRINITTLQSTLGPTLLSGVIPVPRTVLLATVSAVNLTVV